MHLSGGLRCMDSLLFPMRILLFNNEPVFLKVCAEFFLVRDFLQLMTPNPHLDDDLLLAVGW
jgi:hypothetical protein